MTDKDITLEKVYLKEIINYEGIYYVSCAGEIYSVRSKKYLRQTPDKDGYMTVCLCVNNVRKTSKVHRIVATAFIENTDNKPQINHINGNKCKNDFRNLEWATARENVQHAYDTGLKIVSEKARRLASDRCKKIFTGRKDMVGSMNNNAKLTELDIPIIRGRILNGENMSKIGRDYNVTPNCIFEIKIKKKWGHVE
ncbi:MAG: HNH endonuclease [Gammaproteobacteria bacterium]|nr:HNH endonuclease [Gammaproteobacteria bacterium]